MPNSPLYRSRHICPVCQRELSLNRHGSFPFHMLADPRKQVKNGRCPASGRKVLPS